MCTAASSRTSRSPILPRQRPDHRLSRSNHGIEGADSVWNGKNWLVNNPRGAAGGDGGSAENRRTDQGSALGKSPVKSLTCDTRRIATVRAMAGVRSFRLASALLAGAALAALPLTAAVAGVSP